MMSDNPYKDLYERAERHRDEREAIIRDLRLENKRLIEKNYHLLERARKAERYAALALASSQPNQPGHVIDEAENDTLTRKLSQSLSNEN